MQVSSSETAFRAYKLTFAAPDGRPYEKNDTVVCIKNDICFSQALIALV